MFPHVPALREPHIYRDVHGKDRVFRPDRCEVSYAVSGVFPAVVAARTDDGTWLIGEATGVRNKSNDAATALGMLRFPMARSKRHRGRRLVQECGFALAAVIGRRHREATANCGPCKRIDGPAPSDDRKARRRLGYKRQAVVQDQSKEARPEKNQCGSKGYRAPEIPHNKAVGSIRVEDIADDPYVNCSAQNLYKSPEFRKEWESARERRIKRGWKVEGVADRAGQVNLRRGLKVESRVETQNFFSRSSNHFCHSDTTRKLNHC